MPTEMETRNQSSNRKLLSYAEVFTATIPIEFRIMTAASRLGIMTGKTLHAEILDGWAQNLEIYSPSQLQAAFERAEREVAAFPAVSHLITILDRAEFDEQFITVLRGIRRHTWEWQDRPEYQEPDRWDISSPQAIARGEAILVAGKEHPAEPAPTLSPRMVKTLELFGRDGDFHSGLKRLWRDDPTFWTSETERNVGDHGRIAGQIDRDLFACWLRAR
jgi:hypothetical protein